MRRRSRALEGGTLSPVDYDVIIAGGGPAGSTAATMLTRKGWRVLLLEATRFPREHIGESLLPASLPVLQDLGVLEAVREAGFLPKPGATMVWGSSREPWTWLFRETNLTYPTAFQVVRSTFDHLLLRNAQAHGVEVQEGARVLDVEFTGERVAVHYDDGEQKSADGRFFVDATGQSGLLGRKLHMRQHDPEFRNLALYGYFRGGKRLAGEAENSILVESFGDGWSWLIPLHTGLASVGVVVSSEQGQRAIQAHGQASAFHDYLSSTEHTASLLDTAHLETDVTVVRDWSYQSTRMAGERWVLAGDAACFIDPLFSSGVHLALSSAVLASAYVTTALKTTDDALREAAATAYEQLYRQQYRHFREMARLFYASNQSMDTYFWKAKQLIGDELADPREAFVRAVAGQAPQGYERVVLERGDAPSGFAQAVAEVEEERRRRSALVARASAGPLAESRYWQSVPALEPGLQLQRGAVLADGEFEPGYLLSRRSNDAGIPISTLVATALAKADGARTLADVAAAAASDLGVDTHTIAEPLATAFRILYIDGMVRELRGIE